MFVYILCIYILPFSIRWTNDNRHRDAVTATQFNMQFVLNSVELEVSLWKISNYEEKFQIIITIIIMFLSIPKPIRFLLFSPLSLRNMYTINTS